jgi:peptidoglycan/LPS O-acetylase OafA/YrhL
MVVTVEREGGVLERGTTNTPLRASPGDGVPADPGTRTISAGRLVELDGLRGLAAVSVMSYHWLLVDPAVSYGPASGPLTSGMNWLNATPLRALVAGPQMVLLFFVLSGMVLALPRLAGRGAPYGRYLLTRVLRLYPAAWTATALAALALLVLPSHAEIGLSPWVNAQFTAPLPTSDLFHYVGLVVPFNPSRLDGALWSLEQELRVSLVLPLLVVLVRRCRPLLTLALAVALIVDGTASTTLITSWTWTRIVVGCFLLGILLARHREALNGVWAGVSTPWRWLVGLGIVLSFWIPTRSTAGIVDQFHVGNLIPIVGACAAIVVAQGHGMRRRLRARLPTWLGRISYSLYLVHLVVLHLLVGLRPAGVPAIALAPAGIVISLGLATLLQRHVEAPASALGHRLGRRTA